MNLWRKILNRAEREQNRLRSHWYRWQFLLLEKPKHQAVILEPKVAFYVPVKGGRGTLEVGEQSILGVPLAQRLGNGQILLQAREPEAEIILGRDTQINNNAAICAMRSVRIGEHCRIGDCVVIVDCDFHEIRPETRNCSPGTIKPVVVGNNVWIGSRCMVLKGVRIGDNSVIGAMSLVTKDVPSNCVAAGVPAKVLRQITTPQNHASKEARML